ncbi:hypothetical protein FRC08_011120 [Ceratobasidium sp. 394]|nr:hypothetical protein FRC08_011120 [Ceratobasidium sp. 394]
MSIRVEERGSSLNNNKIYFHRCPSARCTRGTWGVSWVTRRLLLLTSTSYTSPLPRLHRSNLQAYWGYISSNIDPTAQEDNLENKGWRLHYTLEIRIHRFVDDWGYKYKQLLKRSIKSIPGSFPGVETEDSSDGEDD